MANFPRTPPRSPSPRPISPSTRANFDRILDDQVFPPPSLPPSPQAESPPSRVRDLVPSSFITVVVLYGTTSLPVDKVGIPIYAWCFKIATAPSAAPSSDALRVRDRGSGEFPERDQLAKLHLRRLIVV